MPHSLARLSAFPCALSRDADETSTTLFSVLLLARTELPPECTVAKTPPNRPKLRRYERKEILGERTFSKGAARHGVGIKWCIHEGGQVASGAR